MTALVPTKGITVEAFKAWLLTLDPSTRVAVGSYLMALDAALEQLEAALGRSTTARPADS